MKSWQDNSNHKKTHKIRVEKCKNWTEEFHSFKSRHAEERSDLEDRILEITQSEEQKEKKMKTYEECLWEL